MAIPSYLEQAARQGYLVVADESSSLLSEFFTWCEDEGWPYIVVIKRPKEAIVRLDISSTAPRLGATRLSDAGLAELEAIYKRWPVHTSGKAGYGGLWFIHTDVPLDQAEPLAKELLDLYDRHAVSFS